MIAEVSDGSLCADRPVLSPDPALPKPAQFPFCEIREMHRPAPWENAPVTGMAT